jgi:Arc/MetJ-type ribon-helix-helix transcriptional regulator
MKMLSVAVDETYARAIDEVIKSTKIYSSRSEFLKDAIRKNLAEILRLGEDLKKIHEESEKLAVKAKARGFKGKQLSRSERAKLAREFLKS